MTPLGWVACVALVGFGALSASRGDWVWGAFFMACAFFVVLGETSD